MIRPRSIGPVSGNTIEPDGEGKQRDAAEGRGASHRFDGVGARMGLTRRGRRTLACVWAGASFASACLCGCTAFSDARGAESVLEFFQGPTAQDAVDMALNEYDPDQRFRGVTLLAGGPAGGTETALELYRELVDDPDAGVRQAAARALGLHGDRSDARALVSLLDDDERLVRLASAQALQRIHDPVAIGPLMNAATERSEPDPVVRAAAARALGQYRQRRVLQALVGVLDDRQLAVNHAARESLRTLTGQDFGLDTSAWLSWAGSTPDPFVAGRVYTYRGYVRDRTLIEWLPFVPDPPQETPAPPVGMPRGLDPAGVGSGGSKDIDGGGGRGAPSAASPGRG